VKENDKVESKYILDVVREKLLNSLNALEKEANAGDTILQSAKRPLSLNAVAEGPKLRLLWAAFLQVEEEARTVSLFSFHCLLYVHGMLFWYNLEF
jgi:RecB family exonuclease